MLALKLLHFFEEDELFNQFAQLHKEDVTVPNESRLSFIQVAARPLFPHSLCEISDFYKSLKTLLRVFVFVVEILWDV